MSTLAHLLVDLLSTAPGLVPIYREHLALHDALLPRAVHGAGDALVERDHARRRASVRFKAARAGEAARTVVGVIESHLTSGDAEVRELIALSFLDSVDASPANEVLRLHFGPSLRVGSRPSGRLDRRLTSPSGSPGTAGSESGVRVRTLTPDSDPGL